MLTMLKHFATATAMYRIHPLLFKRLLLDCLAHSAAGQHLVIASHFWQRALPTQLAFMNPFDYQTPRESYRLAGSYRHARHLGRRHGD
ncbi:hypothetical protein [Chitinimonas sp. BJB300]|uniref:hypothetical protein n=1 Tax=Chitinimonas sp. BJB300 TaxID=1559339 RepID=UPI0013044139|nr:hypothetical protein [Chitinimonas sp. BJB300]